MKKIAHILLICIYSFANMGFSLKQFTCCGELKSITISFTHDTKQKCSKEIENKGCCDNKCQFFKLKEYHISINQFSSPVKHFIPLHFYIPSSQVFFFKNATIAYRSNAPPLDSSGPLYIYNCVFRI